MVGDYGHVIVDECHHVGAASFEAVLRTARARSMLGLTATPIRRDGREPVIFLHYGPFRYRVMKFSDAPADCEVIPRVWAGLGMYPPETGIQKIFRLLAHDRKRSMAVAVERAFTAGRKVLMLTERRPPGGPGRGVEGTRGAALCVARTDVAQGARRYARRARGVTRRRRAGRARHRAAGRRGHRSSTARYPSWPCRCRGAGPCRNGGALHRRIQ
ncbi:DEAD/DEAH box helicase family protein [Acidiferrobacter sp.]|uniref:DEAD/DEAH box helicase n=1 Tax=Acidiferrobacter sp. TaxID=1872107 RepID=UPI003422F1D6